MTDLAVELALAPPLAVALDLAGPAALTCVLGVQGPPGPPGAPSAGLPAFAIDPLTLSAGDLLSYAGSAWTNLHQVNVTDGGNF